MILRYQSISLIFIENIDEGGQIEFKNMFKHITENDLTEEIISRYRNTNIEIRKSTSPKLANFVKFRKVDENCWYYFGK